MKFEEALQLLKEGKKVRRSCWQNGTKLYFRNNEFLIARSDIKMPMGLPYNDITGLPFEYIVADDWEEYKEPLLTQEEKDFLKMIIKFNKYKIAEVSLSKNRDGEPVYFNIFDGGGNDCDTTTYLKPNCFKNLEEGKHYTLKELGLDEA